MRKIIPWVAAGGVVVALVYLGTTKISALSAETKRLQDSLAATQPAFAAKQDTIVQQIVLREPSRKVNHALMTQLRQQRERDSLALVEARTTQDSLTAALRQVITLKGEVATRDQRIRLLVADSADLARGWASERDRREAVERLNASIARDLQKATNCRLLIVRCPTRRESAIGGYVLLRGVESLVAR